MTPPAAAVVAAAVVEIAAVPAPRSAPDRRRRPERAPVVATWACDNCDLPNAARRRRCADCGTSRW